MNETVLNTLVTIIGIIISLFGSKVIYKKYIGRDDNSIKIENSEIKDSFNGRK